MSTLSGMATNNPKAAEAKKLVLDLFKHAEKYPDWKDILNGYTGGDYNVPFLSEAQDLTQAFGVILRRVQGKLNSDPTNEQALKELNGLTSRYRKLANEGAFDSEFENNFERYSNQNQRTRQTPTFSWSVTNPQARDLFKKLEDDYTIDKFDIVEGKWEDDKKKKVHITNFTLEPYGGGLGITFEGQDANGNSVRMVPKKQDTQSILGELNKLVPEADVLNTHLYKGITPIGFTGTKVKLSELANEIEEPGVADIVRKTVGNQSISMDENGVYTLFDAKGKPIKQHSSMYQLLPKLIKNK
jgi:hypothetical protein